MNIILSYVLAFLIDFTIAYCIIQNSFYGNEHLIVKGVINFTPVFYMLGLIVMSVMLGVLYLIDRLNLLSIYNELGNDSHKESILNLHKQYNNNFRKIYSNTNNIFFIVLFAITGHYFLLILEIIIDIIIYLSWVVINSLHGKIVEDSIDE